MLINKKRIINIDNYNITEGNKIGVLVSDNNYQKLGIIEFVDGLVITPSYKYGPTCKKNTFGHFVADKGKPKAKRTVNTIEWTWEQWIGGGRTETHTKLVDIEKEVYQRKEYSPMMIQFICKTVNGNDYIVADLPNECDKELYKHTINMFLEVFGYCQIFDDEYNFTIDKKNIKRCDWEILPKGIKIYVDKKMKEKEQEKNTKRRDFNQGRSDYLQKTNYEDIYVGKNEFDGYYVFKYKNFCILENGFYGNATYIIPSLSWEELTKKTKQELISESLMIDRIIHQSNWIECIKKHLK